MTPGAIALGLFMGVGLTGSVHIVWLLWASRSRAVGWPKHYRVICVGCRNAAISDTGVRGGD